MKITATELFFGVAPIVTTYDAKDLLGKEFETCKEANIDFSPAETGTEEEYNAVISWLEEHLKEAEETYRRIYWFE